MKIDIETEGIDIIVNGQQVLRIDQVSDKDTINLFFTPSGDLLKSMLSEENKDDPCTHELIAVRKIERKEKAPKISKLKLFLLSQDENSGNDTYDSIIVCAKSPEIAKEFHPDWKAKGPKSLKELWKSPWSTWASSPEYVKIIYLGMAAKKFKENEIICASFNKGQ